MTCCAVLERSNKRVEFCLANLYHGMVINSYAYFILVLSFTSLALALALELWRYD